MKSQWCGFAYVTEKYDINYEQEHDIFSPFILQKRMLLSENDLWEEIANLYQEVSLLLVEIVIACLTVSIF